MFVVPLMWIVFVIRLEMLASQKGNFVALMHGVHLLLVVCLECHHFLKRQFWFPKSVLANRIAKGSLAMSLLRFL